MRNLLLFITLFLTLGASAQTNKHRKLYDEIAKISRLNERYLLCDSIIKKTAYAQATRDSISKYNVRNLFDEFSVKKLQDSAYIQFKRFKMEQLVEIRAMFSNRAFADAFDLYSLGILRSDSPELIEIVNKLKANPNAEISSYGNYTVSDIRKAVVCRQLYGKIDDIRMGIVKNVEDWGGYSASQLKKAADDMRRLLQFNVSLTSVLMDVSEEIPNKLMIKLRDAQNNLLQEKGVAYRIR